MNDDARTITLHSRDSSLVVDCSDGRAAIAYWGPRLDTAEAERDIRFLGIRQEAQARVATEAPISLTPQPGDGFPGNPGIRAHRDGGDWGTYAIVESIDSDTAANKATILSRCATTQLSIEHTVSLDPETNVAEFSTEIRNDGEEPICIDAAEAATIPVPSHLDALTCFEGRWSNEFGRHSLPRFLGAYLRENRSGRTSHDSFPAVLLHESSASETQGDVLALHLGWSGNHRLRVEQLSDGRGYAQLGELLLPGELILASGEGYRTPVLYGVRTNDGFTGMSRCLHEHVRTRLAIAASRGRPRPVHFNTWEATYFDLDLERLDALVDAAADVGIERFVLDDGWFRGRRSDEAGLGDWFVDEKVFPEGLTPLIERVRSKGMEFGLWVEPEMVNPDSDLYRDHPDWALQFAGVPLQMARHQLVLDLTRPEVYDYLLECLDALLTEYDIGYLKWDMNRDLTQPGGKDGRAAVHCQTLACYALMAEIRQRHPDVEIESCASGGGRPDYGVLAHTDRIWTSDNNDPLDRLRIQAGCSLFLPPEIMGSHVSPARCHISGRQFDMAMRSAPAIFGHMGVEANLLDLSDDELDELKAAIALHKTHRALLHDGHVVRIDCSGSDTAFGVVSRDRRESLVCYAVTDTQLHSAPGRLRFSGLDADRSYRLSFVWPRNPASQTPSVLEQIDGEHFAGSTLMQAGMQLPILPPNSVLIVYLQADSVDDAT